MSRAHLDYTARTARAPIEGGITDEPQPGFYRLRRGAGSVYRPVAIWHGPPLDPIDGSPLDRSPRLQITFCGRYIWDFTLVWPYCAAEPIDATEYDYLLARVEHAREHDPRDPFGTASGKIDWLESTPPF